MDRIEPLPDPVAGRHVPDRELVALAQRRMLAEEHPGQRFLRQRWEEAFAAVMVALAAIREIYPAERGRLTKDGRATLSHAHANLIACYIVLDELSAEALGELMDDVQRGVILTIAELEERG